MLSCPQWYPDSGDWLNNPNPFYLTLASYKTPYWCAICEPAPTFLTTKLSFEIMLDEQQLLKHAWLLQRKKNQNAVSKQQRLNQCVRRSQWRCNSDSNATIRALCNPLYTQQQRRKTPPKHCRERKWAKFKKSCNHINMPRNSWAHVFGTAASRWHFIILD